MTKTVPLRNLDRNLVTRLRATHFTDSAHLIQTNVTRRYWSQTKEPTFPSWLVQRNVKYSTSFLHWRWVIKCCKHSISCHQRRRRAICKRNGELNSAGGINNKNVASLLNGTPRHKPLWCQNAGYITAPSHKRVARETTLHTPAYGILLKQFTAQFWVKETEEFKRF